MGDILNSAHQRAQNQAHQVTATFVLVAGAAPPPALLVQTAWRAKACADAAGCGIGPWYVCLTKPRQEAYAVSKLQEQDFEVYLPLHESWVRMARQWRKKQSVMFPRYAFVRPTKAGQSVGPVRSTPGVTCMVKFGPVLASLAPQRLKALQQAVALRGLSMPSQPFVPGQHVLFASGPLAGLEGIVSSVAAQRVMVLMQLLGQDQNVLVPFQDLQVVL